MWVILLEALVALCMLLLIVWLTFSSPKRDDDAGSKPGAQEDRDRAP